MLMVIDVPSGTHVLVRNWSPFPPNDDYWVDPEVECPNCGRANPDQEHYRLEGIAQLLAEPLRRRLDEHTAEHGCGTYALPLLDCPVAARLYELAPHGDTITLG